MPIEFLKYPLPARVRHHTAPGLYMKHSELKEVSDSYPPLIEKMDWSKIYSNGKPPDLLDVGCGKGKLLLEQAERHPDKNAMGIEVRAWAATWLQGVIDGEEIGNCHTIWYSVVNGLHFIEDNSIEEVYYLFPDPWSKRKHRKRRAFTTEMLDEYSRIIKKDGKIHLATDVAEVHEYHLEILQSNAKLTYKVVESDEEWGLPVTNKERFCRKENIHFDRIIARLKD